MPNRFLERGQSLVELLVALGVASIILPAVITGFVASREGRAQQQERLSATALVTEAVEAVRSVRERSWVEVATNGTYHLQLTNGSWTLVPGSQTVSGFSRQITIADVSRDTNGVIVESGGTVDPSTKKVTVTVSWTTPFPSSSSTVLYLTRYRNQTFIQTTEADFLAGSATNVIVTNTAGGELTLAAGGQADWCDPNLSIAAVDLPKQGVANGITAVEGLVFAGTGDNASGESYAKVSISNTDPPVGSVEGVFSYYKTNGVFGEANYGYIATDTNAKEIVILDISQEPFAEIGLFDSPGPTNAGSIFVAGDKGYMTAGSNLYIFDLSSKTGSRPTLGSVALSGVGNKVIVVGSFAYVAIESTTTQLQIIDISNSSTPAVVGWASIGGAEGKDIFVNTSGTRAYLATANSSAAPELFIIDITTKSGNQPMVGSYDTSGMSPKGVTVVPGNKAIVVGTGAEEYQVVNIANEASPFRCGGLNIDTGVNGVASVLESDNDAYSYIITGDANAELKIIEGGPGGTYGASGTFESSIFDAGNSVAFNRITASVTTPPATNVAFQVAASDAVTGSCSGASFTFVGPDETAGTSFPAGGGVIPSSNDGVGFENPGRCFRYRVTLNTTDPSQAPVVDSVTINYSP